jgi:hypothetical protein
MEVHPAVIEDLSGVVEASAGVGADNLKVTELF